MNILSKISQIVGIVGKVLIGLNPFLPDKYQHELSIAGIKIDQLYDVIVQVEIFAQALGLDGDQKRKMAAAGIAQIILSSSILIDRKVKDPVMFQAAVEALAGNLADIMNSIEGDVESKDLT